jgi:hypothetical protein
MFMSRPTPTLSEPLIIGQWWRNRSGEAITIGMSTYQGKNVIDIRVWRSTDGRLRPTTKGLTTELKHLPRLAKALGQAVVGPANCISSTPTTEMLNDRCTPPPAEPARFGGRA